jgi:hypothetical protein
MPVPEFGRYLDADASLKDMRGVVMCGKVSGRSRATSDPLAA